MRRRHRSHRLHGLGEPITLAAIPWLWVAGGALFAKLFATPMRDTLTDKGIAEAQKLRAALAERMVAQGLLETGGGISVEEFVAANADLMDPSLYASGKAPTKQELVNEIVAIVKVAKARSANVYTPFVRTLQGRV